MQDHLDGIGFGLIDDGLKTFEAQHSGRTPERLVTRGAERTTEVAGIAWIDDIDVGKALEIRFPRV
jgi:hypothetical protein